MFTRNLQKIGHFIAIAKAGSLSAAARELNISQPALTASMRKLEQSLGFPLFDRENGFRLSPQGRAFLARAEPSFERIGHLQREVEMLRNGALGEIHIACGATVADGPIGIAIGRLIDAHPGLRVNVLVCRIKEMPALLRDRSIDLFVAAESLIPRDADLEFQLLADHEVMFYCRAGHPLAGKGPVSLEEFFSYPHFGPPLPQWALDWFAKNHPGSTPRNPLQLESNHHALLKTAVEAGNGISGAPFSVIESEVELGRLAVINVETMPMRHQAGIFWLKAHPPTKLGRLLIDEMSLLDGI